MATPQQTAIDDLIRSAEQTHEQYIRSLRTLHDGLGPRKRERADSRNSTIASAAATPPLRAMSGPTFASEPAPHLHHPTGMTSTATASVTIPRRARRLTLEVDPPDRTSFCPSPKPFRPSPNPSDCDFTAVHDDDELCFIPLLDSHTYTPPRRTTVEEIDTAPRVHRPLTPMAFSDDMLLRHLQNADALGDELAGVLDGDALRRRVDLDAALSFREFALFERERYVSSTFEVYDVLGDASARKTSVEVDGQGLVKYSGDGSPLDTSDGIVDAPMVWESIRDVNPDGQSMGRITIVQEPTPLILAALHLTMSPHFDMSELLAHLLSDAPNRGRTRSFMHRAFERATPFPHHHQSQPSYPPPCYALPPFPRLPSKEQHPHVSFSHLRQRSFFFVFKYYTAVGEGLEPAPWQRFDKRPSDKRIGDHIDIAECSSVLALSLGGEPTKQLRMRPRRERAREGFLFDTFAPWHLLSMQSFPDDLHTVRSEEFQQKSFYNGPYAFLELLVAEYRDAGKRNQVLHDRITKLITPPTEFMFNHRLRDKLLFEDKHFTYIRRYFWAYNTLAVINTGIKAMVSAHVDTFTEDFWAGNHPLLWPYHANSSCNPASSPPFSSSAEAAAAAYRDKMAVLRRELDKVVSELGEVLKKNERTRKEIENLRDQLFSGSSIKESRRAIDQGDNIRILTMISMIFLPLTFVTSVFGITEFTIPASDWRFPLTMVLVCVPFMLVIFLLQTRSVTVLLRALFATFASRVVRRWSHHVHYPDNNSGNIVSTPFIAAVPELATSAPDGPQPATTPRRPRKRRRPVVEGKVSAPGSVGRWWKWSWMRRTNGGEDVDLSRV